MLPVSPRRARPPDSASTLAHRISIQGAGSGVWSVGLTEGERQAHAKAHNTANDTYCDKARDMREQLLPELVGGGLDGVNIGEQAQVRPTSA